QGQFSASLNGFLAYTSGLSADVKTQLTWFDRSGRTLGTVGAPAAMTRPALSPDGLTIAVDRQDSAGLYDIWLHDLVLNTSSRFTFGPSSNRWPLWSPDGKYVIYHKNGRPYRKAVSGVGQEEAIDQDPQFEIIDDWSRDGRYMIKELFGAGYVDIWVM